MDISVVHDVRNEGLGAGMGAQSPKHAAELKRYVDRYGYRDFVRGRPPRDLGKRWRRAAFRAYSACETAQKFAGDFGD